MRVGHALVAWGPKAFEAANDNLAGHRLWSFATGLRDETIAASHLIAGRVADFSYPHLHVVGE